MRAADLHRLTFKSRTDSFRMHDLLLAELVKVSYWAPGAVALVAFQPELI